MPDVASMSSPLWALEHPAHGLLRGPKSLTMVTCRSGKPTRRVWDSVIPLSAATSVFCSTSALPILPGKARFNVRDSGVVAMRVVVDTSEIVCGSVETPTSATAPEDEATDATPASP